MADALARSLRIPPLLRLAIVMLVCGTFVGSAGVASAIAPGDTLWVKRYDGPSPGHDLDYALAASPDGTKVFVTGGSFNPTTYADFATVAYDASTGAKVWVKRFDGSGHGDDYAYAIAASPDGTKVFVTGE